MLAGVEAAGDESVALVVAPVKLEFARGCSSMKTAAGQPLDTLVRREGAGGHVWHGGALRRVFCRREISDAEERVRVVARGKGVGGFCALRGTRRRKGRA